MKILEQYIHKEDIEAFTFSSKPFGNDVTKYENDRRSGHFQFMSGVELMKKNLLVVGLPYTIYKVEFLREHNLEMIAGIYHEDSEFTPRAYYYLNKILVLGDVFYLRRENPESITHVFRPKRIFDLVEIVDFLYDFMLREVEICDRYIIADKISIIINQQLFDYYRLNVDERKAYREIMVKRAYLYDFMKISSKRKYRIEGSLFSLCPNYITGIYGVLNIFYRFLR